MKHNNEFASSKVWTVKAFVVESPIVAKFFCICKHVFKGFVFIAKTNTEAIDINIVPNASPFIVQSPIVEPSIVQPNPSKPFYCKRTPSLP